MRLSCSDLLRDVCRKHIARDCVIERTKPTCTRDTFQLLLLLLNRGFHLFVLSHGVVLRMIKIQMVI